MVARSARLLTPQQTTHDGDHRKRRHLFIALATALGLVADITQYENFLFLIGSVFIPLFAVRLVDYHLLQRRRWNPGPLAPSRPAMVVPWLLGFVAYQLLNPGTVPGWSERWTRAQAALHLSPPPVWLSASLASFAVAALSTLLVGAVGVARLRASRS